MLRCFVSLSIDRKKEQNSENVPIKSIFNYFLSALDNLFYLAQTQYNNKLAITFLCLVYDEDFYETYLVTCDNFLCFILNNICTQFTKRIHFS